MQKTTLTCGHFYTLSISLSGTNVLLSEDDDYKYLLNLFTEMVQPIAELFAFCIVPQGFQFLVQIKNEETVFLYLKHQEKFPDEMMSLSDLKALSQVDGLNNIDLMQLHISKMFTQFNHSFFSEMIKKHGKLSNKLVPLKMSEISDLKSAVENIHFLPIFSKLTKELGQWKYSSYNALVSDKPTKIKREEVINWFTNKDIFISNHQQHLIANEKQINTTITN